MKRSKNRKAGGSAFPPATSLRFQPPIGWTLPSISDDHVYVRHHLFVEASNNQFLSGWSFNFPHISRIPLLSPPFLPYLGHHIEGVSTAQLTWLPYIQHPQSHHQTPTTIPRKQPIKQQNRAGKDSSRSCLVHYAGVESEFKLHSWPRSDSRSWILMNRQTQMWQTASLWKLRAERFHCILHICTQ